MVKKKKKKSKANEPIRKVKAKKPTKDELLGKAHLILEHSHDTAQALHKAYQLLRKSRTGTRGALTDEEQDLWRAMIVMAASGLDSLVKQVLRDALWDLCRTHSDVASGLKTYVKRRLKDDKTRDDLIASALISENPRSKIIELYVKALTGDSLQSAAQLQKANNALGLDVQIPQDLKKVFDARNQIIHELDVDFDAARRNRRSRPIKDYCGKVNTLLELTESFYTSAQNKLSED